LLGATVIAVAGLASAWRLLDPARLRPAAESPAESGLARVLWKKYYVDEVYDALVVRPLVWLSERVLWKVTDAFVIDGIGVNGSARVMRFAGWVGTRLQTGHVGTYVGLFVLGTLALLRVLTR
jgi:NADH-quinone oxidoreductase subunit L